MKAGERTIMLCMWLRDLRPSTTHAAFPDPPFSLSFTSMQLLPRLERSASLEMSSRAAICMRYQRCGEDRTDGPPRKLHDV